MQQQCDECLYGVYDDECGDYTCSMLWEEDVCARQSQGYYKTCPYFRPGDDYSLVRQQN